MNRITSNAELTKTYQDIQKAIKKLHLKNEKVVLSDLKRRYLKNLKK